MHSCHQGGSQSYHLIWKPDWNVWASKIIWSCKSIPCRLLDWWSLFLAGCWPEANLSSLPCESALFACFIKASKGDSATKTKMRTFWNLITEVASLQHWGIALVSSKLLMGRELHKAMNTRWGLLEMNLESAYHNRCVPRVMLEHLWWVSTRHQIAHTWVVQASLKILWQIS